MDWASLPNPSHLPAGDLGNPLDGLPSEEPGDIDQVPSFRYLPLQTQTREIRILYLRGSHGENNTPAGTLRHESLDSKPQYLALSYVWGDQKETLPIFVDGHRFLVGLNLYSALEHLQQRAGTHDLFVALWIDAICINQVDNTEKSSQVQMMGEIYSSSQFTLSWLGPEADDSNLAIRALDYIGEQCVEHPDGPALQERCELFTRILPESDTDEWNARFPVEAVVALLNRPYWRRIWIVQEVILPPTVFVVCGELITTFGALAVGATALLELPILDSTLGGPLTSRIRPLIPVYKCDPKLIQAAFHHGATGKKLPLASRLQNITQMGATNPLDHVFGLMGLASDLDELGIQADYSLAPLELFTRVTAALLKQGSRQFLSRCSAGRNNGPSWTVDFSRDRSGEPAPIWNYRYKLYRAGGSTVFQRALSVEGNILRVSGAVVDTIEALGPLPLQAPDPIGSYLASLEEFAHSACPGYGSLDRLTDAIHRLPFLDMEVALFRKTGRYNKRLGQDSATRYFAGLRESTERLEIALPHVSVHAAAITAIVNHQTFSTVEGRLGIGPVDTKPGDLVCVFHGCEVPFVVRPTPDSTVTSTGKWLWKKQELHCTLVGESYVYGIMDGEGLNSGVKTDFHIH
ncbi:heterokaryon incompatibility protein-domain-containing protein [Immersiella caudata]|uniref:Heterokaryon incompatibility protein-domain-containing protein n=1 Tax=Immersiella caudata TaxID=314043 RepID=A0AA39WZ77_9PEZI|nr:heterokaryon incompatibility protein-domain-containing protein [Immersiella caudata]